MLPAEELSALRQALIVQDSLVIALQPPAPALVVYGPGRTWSWGREGDGPGELRNPVQLRLRGDTVFVLDMIPGASRVALYHVGGTFLTTVRLPGLATRFGLLGDHLIVEVREFGNTLRHLLRVERSGDVADTLWTFTAPPTVKLRPPSGPSYTTALPFAPVTRWTATGDMLVLWEPGTPGLTVLSAPSFSRRSVPLPARPAAQVTPADRDRWFETEFPRGVFLGRRDDPLGAVRELARRVVSFPDTFPSVLDLKDDARGRVWTKQAPASQGERWAVAFPAGGCANLRLPPRRELLAIGATVAVAKGQDQETDAEFIELYAVPERDPCAEAGRGSRNTSSPASTESYEDRLRPTP